MLLFIPEPTRVLTHSTIYSCTYTFPLWGRWRGSITCVHAPSLACYLAPIINTSNPRSVYHHNEWPINVVLGAKTHNSRKKAEAQRLYDPRISKCGKNHQRCSDSSPCVSFHQQCLSMRDEYHNKSKRIGLTNTQTHGLLAMRRCVR